MEGTAGAKAWRQAHAQLFRESQETRVARVGRLGREREETRSESRSQIWEGLVGH